VSQQPDIALSVIAPAHNERDNLPALVEEIARAIDPLAIEYEVIIIDDGSTDDTHAVLSSLQMDYAQLRSIRMMETPPGKGNGQSAAFHAGIRASRGGLVAMLDADLQNDPADLPAMLELLRTEQADFVQGDRSKNRRDTIVRRVTSMIGRAFRRVLLGDTIVDTGCSLRVMKREIALRLPLEFRGVHRFIPVSARQMGYRVIEMPVHHRARTAGKAKYGVWNRAIPGLIDCLAIRWMRHRRRPVTFAEHERMSATHSTTRSSAPARQPEKARS